jgi:hypothetical protein
VPETSLADGLAKLSGALVLSTEHQQIKRLIDGARRYRLTPPAVALVDRILDTAPWTLEHSLDAIAHPDERPIWIEFGDEPRRREGLAFGGRDVDRIGYLVSPSPADDNAVVLVVAWRLASGTIHHAYSVVHWHRLDLIAHAAKARNRYSRVRAQAMARMMALITVSTPLGFRDIVGEMHFGEDRRLEQAALMDGRLAASGEALFAFGCLAALAGSEAATRSDDGFEIVEAPSTRRGLLDRIGDRLVRRSVPSFVRLPGANAPSILVVA